MGRELGVRPNVKGVNTREVLFNYNFEGATIGGSPAKLSFDDFDPSSFICKTVLLGQEQTDDGSLPLSARVE